MHALDDRELAHKAQSVLLGRAARAREDPFAFFEFVMREEERQLPLRMAEHQKVMIDFAMNARDRNGYKGRSVQIVPVEHAKTFSQAALALCLIARNVSIRGAFVSATQAQAAKPLRLVRETIEVNPAYRLVAPHVQPGALWTDAAITVQRPYGTRDATMAAYGMDSSRITGSRLDFINADDLLTAENVATPEQRQKVWSWFQKYCLHRLTQDGVLVVSNSAQHSEDLPHKLIELGWPALVMDCYGGIEFHNTTYGYEGEAGEALVESDPDEPSKCRLTRQRRVPKEERVLFPERFTVAKLQEKRDTTLPAVFAQNFLSQCRDDETAMCRQEYVDLCKARARELGIRNLVERYDGPYNCFTGVDLAFKKGEKYDYTAFFTFELRPDGLRVLLDVEYGQWATHLIVEKIVDKARRYNSIVAVESNAAQVTVQQWARSKDQALPIKPYTTTATKHHVEFGVPRLFLEMAQGAWAIPCDPRTPYKCHPMVQKFIDGALNYTPEKHTDDGLMACFFAREMARKFGAGGQKGGKAGPSVGATIMSR